MESRPSAPAGYEVLSVLREAPRPVYIANDPSIGSRIHLKQARSRTAALREARALRRVAGPFTPRFIRLIREAETYWIAVEWIDGVPLSQASPSGTTWPADLVRAIVHLHRWGVVHGDLKPANLLQRSDGTFCVVDFEMASRTGEEVALEEAGGTRGYVAPERLSGWPADPRSDLYSLGVTLRAMGDFPPPMLALVDQLLAESPGKRPATTDALLRDFVAQVGIGSVPTPDLDLSGWRSDRISTDHLAAGIRAYLGSDPVSAWKLAQELQRASGETRRVAERLWSRWLPEVTADPWQPTEAERLQGAMGRLQELAREESGTWYQEAPTDARKAAAFLAQLGESFATEEIDRLVRIVGNRSDCQEEGGVLQQVDDRIEELLDTGVLRRVGSPNVDPPASLRFANKEIWGVAQTSLDSQLARQVHRALAEGLESDLNNVAEPSPDSLDHLAWHWKEAGDAGRAGDFWFRAGDRAYQLHQKANAASYFDQAWATLTGWDEGSGKEVPHLPSDAILAELKPEEAAERIDLYARTLASGSRHSESDLWYERLLALEPSDTLIATYHRGKAELKQLMRQIDEVLRHVDKGLQHAEDSETLRGRLYFHKAQVLIGQTNRIQEGIEAGERACEIAAIAGDDEYLSNARSVLGVAYYHLSRFEDARNQLLSSLTISAKSGHKFQEALAHTNLVAVESRLGNQQQARNHMNDALDIALANNYRNKEMVCLLNLAHFAYLEQNWKQGLEYAERALKIALEIGDRPSSIRSLMTKANLLIRSGRVPQAERTCVEALRFGQTDPSSMQLLGIRLVLLHCRVWFRRTPMEVEFVRELTEAVERSGNPQHSEECRILGACNDLLQERDLIAVADRLESPAKKPELETWRLLAEARLARAIGERERSLGLVENALDSADREPPDRFMVAYGLMEKARYLVQDRSTHAIETQRECIEIARAIKARWIEAQALLLVGNK